MFEKSIVELNTAIAADPRQINNGLRIIARLILFEAAIKKIICNSMAAKYAMAAPSLPYIGIRTISPTTLIINVAANIQNIILIRPEAKFKVQRKLFIYINGIQIEKISMEV